MPYNSTMSTADIFVCDTLVVIIELDAPFIQGTCVGATRGEPKWSDGEERKKWRERESWQDSADKIQ